MWIGIAVKMPFWLACLSTVIIIGTASGSSLPKLIGLRVEDVGLLVANSSSKIVRVRPQETVTIRLLGTHMHDVDEVLFSSVKHKCVLTPGLEPIEPKPINQDTFTVKVRFPREQHDYYVCLKPNPPNQRDRRSVNGESFLNDTNPELLDGANSTVLPSVNLEEFVFQGIDPYRMVGTAEAHVEHFLPVPLQILIVAALLVLSGLFSGLNLGLMSLDLTELKIILKSGSKKEKTYAKRIYPVREKGNYLLCSLLLGNVVVNSAISILFDDLTSSFVALIGASLGIVILGEIVPQSICSRYGLAVGANTIFITRFFMFLTSPLSWPISKLLDKILGEEVGNIYNKQRLLELIRLSKEDSDFDLGNCAEVAIVSGALELSSKKVKDVMTNIQDIYALPSDAILDSKLIGQIIRSGFTRVPVYGSGNKEDIVTMLNVKDLALIDPEDKIPLNTICQFYQHPIRFILEDTPLDVLLEEFKKGHYHMAFVQRINYEGPGDPKYQLVGLVTLEDIIEEILQSEINDETDIITDNRRRLFRNDVQVKDLSLFTEDVECYNISPQLAVATYQYLSTSVPPLGVNCLAPYVLQGLIKKYAVECKAPEEGQPAKLIYLKDKPADYYILVLEGRVEVTAGRDNFLFEAGPFFQFGIQLIESLSEEASKCVGNTGNATLRSELLKVSSFVPDFTARITQDVVFLLLKTTTYLSAYRTTVVAQSQEFPNVDLWLASQSQYGSRTTIVDGVEASQEPKRKYSAHVQSPSFDDANQPKSSMPPRKTSGRSEAGRKYLRSMSIASVEKFLTSMLGGGPKGQQGHPLSQEDLHYQVLNNNNNAGIPQQQDSRHLMRANTSANRLTRRTPVLPRLDAFDKEMSDDSRRAVLQVDSVHSDTPIDVDMIHVSVDMVNGDFPNEPLLLEVVEIPDATAGGPLCPLATQLGSVLERRSVIVEDPDEELDERETLLKADDSGEGLVLAIIP